MEKSILESNGFERGCDCLGSLSPFANSQNFSQVRSQLNVCYHKEECMSLNRIVMHRVKKTGKKRCCSLYVRFIMKNYRSQHALEALKAFDTSTNY